MRWELIADSDYMVSSDGGVCLPLSLGIHHRHTAVKQRSDGRGYLCVDIKVDYKIKTVKVHTLVAETFLGPTPKGYHIDHIDHDKTNNRLSNLRWRKASENSADCKRGAREQKATPLKQKAAGLLHSFHWTTKQIADCLEVGESTIRRWKRAFQEKHSLRSTDE